MPDVSTNQAMVRELLDQPDPGRPNESLLNQIFGNQVMHHQTQLQNSGAPWSVESFLLTVSAGLEDYSVPVSDFGKPFWIHSEDLSDPYRPRIEIPFSLIQNADMFYQGPRQVYSNNDNNPRAVVMSIYKKPTGFYVRVTPVPGGTTYYRVWYETAPDLPATLGDIPGLTPFHHLLRIQTCNAALPYCAWGALSCDSPNDKHVERWEKKCAALGGVFSKQEAQFQRQFETYLSNLLQAGVESRDPYGEDYMEDMGYAGYILGPNRA